MSSAATHAAGRRSVAVITGSTRTPRLSPGIAAYVHGFLAEKAAAGSLPCQVELVDLAEQNLPLYDEPAIPSHLPAADPTPHYVHQHTRSWSTKVRAYDAFIFVTPQYNWSVPASLKNALDYLFHEWAAKPAAIVSFGGRGGGKAAKHLREILTGLRMKPVAIETAITIRSTLLDTYRDTGSIPQEVIEVWREAGVEQNLSQAWDEVVAALQPA